MTNKTFHDCSTKSVPNLESAAISPDDTFKTSYRLSAKMKFIFCHIYKSLILSKAHHWWYPKPGTGKNLDKFSMSLTIVVYLLSSSRNKMGSTRLSFFVVPEKFCDYGPANQKTLLKLIDLFR